MAKLLKLRRGTTTQHGSFTGAEGEVTVDTDKETLVVHDGSTAGGHPVAAEDMANVSSASIAGRLANDSIAPSKIGAGALPSDVTIASANIVNGTIATDDIGGSQITTAKIAGNAVTNPKIAENAVTAFSIADATITATQIANDAVTNGKIAADAVTTAKIADDAITAALIADGAIGAAAIGNDAVGSAELADNAVATSRIQDGAVTTAKIADDAVEFSKIQNISQNRLIGRTASGTGDATELTAANVRNMINVEDGATADQSASEILTAIKTVDGSGSGLDADTLDGLQPSAGTGGSTIVQRNASGYVFANYFNTTANDVGSGVTKVMVETGNDNYIRHGNADSIRTFINVENGATADQTGAEIASALNGQNIYTTGNIGRDSNDYILFDNNDRMDIFVNGSNEFRFRNNGDFHADGDVIAQSTTISSDAKLKEDIELVPDALGKLNKLNGVTFKWKRSNEKSAGVIAQDVQKVLPEAVKEVTAVSNGETHLSVNYHALTSILIEAVKELQAEVEKLKGGK